MHLGQVELIVIRPFPRPLLLVCLRRAQPLHRWSTLRLIIWLCVEERSWVTKLFIYFPSGNKIFHLIIMAHIIYYYFCWFSKANILLVLLVKKRVSVNQTRCCSPDGGLPRRYTTLKLIGLVSANLVMCGLHKPTS